MGSCSCLTSSLPAQVHDRENCCCRSSLSANLQFETSSEKENCSCRRRQRRSPDNNKMVLFHGGRSVGVAAVDEDDGAHGRAGLEVLYTNWSETAAGNKHTVALGTGAKVQEKIRPLSSNFGPLVAIFSVLTIFVEKVDAIQQQQMCWQVFSTKKAPSLHWCAKQQFKAENTSYCSVFTVLFTLNA